MERDNLESFIKGFRERLGVDDIVSHLCERDGWRGASCLKVLPLGQGDEVSAYTTLYVGKDHLNDGPTSSPPAIRFPLSAFSFPLSVLCSLLTGRILQRFTSFATLRATKPCDLVVPETRETQPDQGTCTQQTNLNVV